SRAQHHDEPATAGRDRRERAPAPRARGREQEARCHRRHRTQHHRTQAPDRRTHAMSQPARHDATSGKRKARILVVDDDPGLLRLLTIRLRAENYDVEAVENGVAAVAAASRFRPDLVITDLRMDQMDGIGLLKELQSRWPGLKVILLTALGQFPDAVL